MVDNGWHLAVLRERATEVTMSSSPVSRDDPMWGRLVKKIVSGGQTGADRGALDAAIALSIPHGGWCPLGWRAEDGVIPPEYQLTETPAANYQVRTKRNVKESDGTVVFSRGPLEGGSLFTAEYAGEVGRPLLHVDFATQGDRLGPVSAELKRWVLKVDATVINVAGPRESKAPGIGSQVREFLVRSLRDPETIDEAAEKLVWELDDEQRAELRALDEGGLIDTHFALGMYVRNTYGLFRKDCPLLAADPFGHEDDVSGEIIRRAWEKLRAKA